ncbi:MAG: 1,4-dihydroxy-2-naphthoate octaprenyltransferase [Lentisphaerales bacterium]|jgi:1,4-dihydroxy-2-naphthoate octaprenyltransferase|nr:MAG: 1,4-dihydroxy-2-naphthoate octaprenyltransferase [Lentisphaerales bacterium]
MKNPDNAPIRRPKFVLLLQELRAPFFTGSVVPILVGTSLAYYHTSIWNWPLFLLALVGIVLIHAGANVANDYFDHLSGNDAANRDFVRPFTGGSRMIQNNLLSPREVLALSLACFAMGSAIGIYLVMKAGWLLLALGVIGVLGGFFYTAPPISLVSRGIGEFVIGINFGGLPVIGAYYVQTQVVRWETVLFSLPVAFLIAAILFINQFQDYEADKAVGKRNWVVRLGRRKSAWVLAILMSVCWMLPIVAAVVFKVGPVLCLIALIPVLAAFKAIRTAFRHYDHPRHLAPANAMTIISHLAVGLLLSISLIVCGWGKTKEPLGIESDPVQSSESRH